MHITQRPPCAWNATVCARVCVCVLRVCVCACDCVCKLLNGAKPALSRLPTFCPPQRERMDTLATGRYALPPRPLWQRAALLFSFGAAKRAILFELLGEGISTDLSNLELVAEVHKGRKSILWMPFLKTSESRMALALSAKLKGFNRWASERPADLEQTMCWKWLQIIYVCAQF